MDIRPKIKTRRAVAALIATRGRSDLLRRRALRSILEQTRLPDKLVVVVDQTAEELADDDLEALGRTLQSDCGDRVLLEVLRNRRTEARASGAWNTGIDHLHRDHGIMLQAGRWFVAILDDDDAWAPDHLDSCLDVAIAADLNMVASGLIRHEHPDDAGHLHSIPDSLDARQQFISGQHIQGSNLFVRLDTLLLAGCFDEHLPSCTDRDLCIRLSALPGLRFGSTARHTVHHYGDARSDRLSARASRTKLDGLTRFWQKHADRFDDGARNAAAERALRLFDWRASENIRTDPVSRRSVPPLSPSDRRLSLIVGFVTDACPRPQVESLLGDLLRLQTRPDISDLAVVIVENGPIPLGKARPLHDLIRSFQEQGLRTELITIERQREDWAKGRLIDTPDPTGQRLKIPVTRTIINTYVARFAEQRPGAAAWILDDDKRLSVRVDAGDHSEDRESPDVGVLLVLRDAGVDVVIGPDTEAAPLPFIATIRVQLLDLERQVASLETVLPTAAWKTPIAADDDARAEMPDFYYDLSKSTEHLETPLSLAPPDCGRTMADALRFCAERVGRVRAGEAVFRPLAIRPESFETAAAVESVQRGGSAVFFTPKHLVAYPQTLSRIGDRFVRRSDMLITQLMRDQMGLRIVTHAAAGVRHDRSFTTPSALDDVTCEDVLGYALYRAADELMTERPLARRREPLLAWTPGELDEAVRRVKKYVAERLASLTLSAWRIRGLAESIRHSALRLAEGTSEWSQGEARTHLYMIAEEMDTICREFQPSRVTPFAKKIQESISDADIRNTLASMDRLIGQYRSMCVASQVNDGSVMVAREHRARSLLQRSFDASHLKLLGAGGEGVVLTDGVRVFKVLERLADRQHHDTPETLRALSTRLDEPRHLYPIESVEEHEDALVVVYPYEASEPYSGGRGTELLALLRECKANGVVCRNMHPKNLRVSATGLKLIDYGSDIRPYTEDGYRSMAERAWLSWRWPHRPDLGEVMRRAIGDKSIPELDGLDRFWRALNEEHPAATLIVSSIVDPIILESGAKSVLDYGCGKKAHSARRYADAGLRSVGFDPGAEMPARWRSFGGRSPGFTLTSDRLTALKAGPFDAVVSSLVLCELGDGQEYEQVLADIRAAVAADGVVVVTVCNPFGTFGGPTNLHRRRSLPEEMTYEDSFWYVENGETGTCRREFHRPLSKIERDLLRHGLRVERTIASDTVDTERFEPASDFLTLVCRPVTSTCDGPSVSLLIKTCAMEYATIERQVTHLVRQLEGPRAFCERVLVIDPRSDDFVRQHSSANMDELVRAAERLRAQRVVDRVLPGPGPGARAREVMERWFDVPCEETHSVAGAPLVAPLWAIEQCLGEYVLQVDSDILIHRASKADDYLGEMIDAVERTPKAVTASLSVPQRIAESFSPGRDGVPWRVEVRGGLFHKARLMDARPFCNRMKESAPTLSWHRAMDQAAKEGTIVSLRGGSTQTAFVHPPNELKRHVPEWMLLLDLIEKYQVPEAQVGRVDIVGGPLTWIPRDRAEPFIFVLTGRNVPPGRMARCLESVAAQHRTDWGAVVIDDGSASLAREAIQLAVKPWRDRITLIQPRERRGQLANMTLAIRHVCSNPNSVIVTLDLDDALIGPKVLDRVAEAYSEGAELTVGSMLRTDKHVEYPVTFEAPRQARGGNVWQHLRTFRKYLFDAIRDQDLRVDDKYVDIAVDWSFMLPITEMAKRKAWIRDPVYLYETSGMGKGADRADREAMIASIVSKPTRRPRTPGEVLTPIYPEEISSEIWGDEGGILFVRHGRKPTITGLDAERRDAEHLADHGRCQAAALGQRLGHGIHVVCSPVLPAVQTAAAIAAGAGTPHEASMRLESLVKLRLADTQTYDLVKSRFGWAGLMEAWMDGSLAEGVLIPCHAVASTAIRDVLATTCVPGRTRVVAVTHDYVVMALLASLRGVRNTAVPHLGGVFVSTSDANAMVAEEHLR